MEFYRGSWGWFILAAAVFICASYFIIKSKLPIKRGVREMILVSVMSLFSIFGRYLMSERYIIVSGDGVMCSSWRERLSYQSILDVAYVNESEKKWKILDAIFWPKEYIVFTVVEKYPGNRYGPQVWRAFDGVWYVVCDAYGYSNLVPIIKERLK